MTLFDNILRPIGSVEFISGAKLGTTLTSYMTSGLNYTVAVPACTINPDQCISLINDYTAYVNFAGNTTATISAPPVSSYTDCNFTGAAPCPDDLLLDAYGGVAQLLYWPEEDVPSLN